MFTKLDTKVLSLFLLKKEPFSVGSEVSNMELGFNQIKAKMRKKQFLSLINLTNESFDTTNISYTFKIFVDLRVNK